MEESQTGGPAKGRTRTVIGVCPVTTAAIPIPDSPPLEAELTVTAEKIAAGVLRVLVNRSG